TLHTRRYTEWTTCAAGSDIRSNSLRAVAERVTPEPQRLAWGRRVRIERPRGSGVGIRLLMHALWTKSGVGGSVGTGFSLMFTSPPALIVSSPTRRDTMKEAIGYVRVSSEEQADSGLGLEAQRQRIIAFCALKGLRLAEVFEDAGVSGGKPLSSRPSGSRLLGAARRGKVVVVAKL